MKKDKEKEYFYVTFDDLDDLVQKAKGEPRDSYDKSSKLLIRIVENNKIRDVEKFLRFIMTEKI